MFLVSGGLLGWIWQQGFGIFRVWRLGSYLRVASKYHGHKHGFGDFMGFFWTGISQLEGV